MDIEQFVQKIKFNDLQPMQNGVGRYANVDFEFSNTVFPEDNDLIKSNIEIIKNIPKYSTFNARRSGLFEHWLSIWVLFFCRDVGE